MHSPGADYYQVVHTLNDTQLSRVVSSRLRGSHDQNVVTEASLKSITRSRWYAICHRVLQPDQIPDIGER